MDVFNNKKQLSSILFNIFKKKALITTTTTIDDCCLHYNVLYLFKKKVFLSAAQNIKKGKKI